MVMNKNNRRMEIKAGINTVSKNLHINVLYLTVGIVNPIKLYCSSYFTALIYFQWWPMSKTCGQFLRLLRYNCWLCQMDNYYYFIRHTWLEDIASKRLQEWGWPGGRAALTRLSLQPERQLKPKPTQPIWSCIPISDTYTFVTRVVLHTFKWYPHICNICNTAYLQSDRYTLAMCNTAYLQVIHICNTCNVAYPLVLNVIHICNTFNVAYPDVLKVMHICNTCTVAYLDVLQIIHNFVISII